MWKGLLVLLLLAVDVILVVRYPFLRAGLWFTLFLLWVVMKLLQRMGPEDRSA